MIWRMASCLSLVVMLAAPGAAAREVTQQDLEQAQRERDLAQALQQKAEAEASAAKARLGTIDTSLLPKGSGEATTLNIEGTVMAYRAASRIADDIAAVVRNKPEITQIVLFSEKQLNAVMQYRAFVRQTRLFEQAIVKAAGGDPDRPRLPTLEADAGKCKPPTEKAVERLALPAFDTVNVALQVLSLFKTDRKVTGHDVSLDEYAVAAVVLDKLLHGTPPIKVAFPPSYLPALFTTDADPFAQSVALQGFQALVERQPMLAQLRTLVARKREDLKTRHSSATADCKSVIDNDLKVLDGFETKVIALDTALTQLQTGLLKLDDATGASGLQSLLVSELLARSFQKAHVLQIKPVAAGGATMAKTNLFSTRFFFSGGAIVSYMLFNGATGDLVGSGTLTRYAGFVKEGELDE